MHKYYRKRKHKTDRHLEGILLIDKPSGITSHDVVDDVRKKLGMRRVGHGGTLDPLATGVLIVLVGKATKLFDTLMGMDKGYLATMRLGAKTTSGDADGDIVENKDYSAVNQELVEKVAAEFVGELMQVPPMYSALRYEGKRLYEYAREGIQLDIPARPITIYDNQIKKCDFPDIEFYTRVSKGTYIRKIAEDMGEALGTYAYITALRRTEIGPFMLENCIQLDEVSDDKIIPVEEVRISIEEYKEQT